MHLQRNEGAIYSFWEGRFQPLLISITANSFLLWWVVAVLQSLPRMITSHSANHLLTLQQWWALLVKNISTTFWSIPTKTSHYWEGHVIGILDRYMTFTVCLSPTGRRCLSKLKTSSHCRNEYDDVIENLATRNSILYRNKHRWLSQSDLLVRISVATKQIENIQNTVVIRKSSWVVIITIAELKGNHFMKKATSESYNKVHLFENSYEQI